MRRLLELAAYLVLGLVIVLVIAVSIFARAQSADPGITVYRAGIFCVFAGPMGIAITAYEVYAPRTLRLVPCPQIGDLGPVATPSGVSP